MKKRIISLLLALCVVIAMLPVMANAADSYNPTAAATYARNNYNKSGELCAGFVSHSLQAGGINIYYAGVGNLYRSLKSEGFKEYPMKYSGDQYKLSDNPNAAVGDIIIFHCTNPACASTAYKHSVIITAIDNGVIKATGTNSAKLDYQYFATYRAGESCTHGKANEGRGIVAYLMHWEGATNSNTVTPPTNASTTVSLTAPTDANYTSKQSIGRTNAVLVTKVNKNAGTNVSAVGISLFDASGKLIKNYTEKISNVSASSTFFHVWFDVNSEVGVTLTPNTSYQYQFFATSGSGTVYGSKNNFTTSYNTYNVTLNTNGGNVSSSNFAIKENGTYGNLPTPTREGYTFNGWYTAASGGTKVTSNSKVSNSNHTLFAQWTGSNFVSVTFNDNGRLSISIEYSDRYVAGKSYGNLQSDPQREGYTFLGWFTAKTGGSRVTSGSIVPNGAHTLYAQWEAVAKDESKPEPEPTKPEPQNNGAQTLSATLISDDQKTGTSVGVKLEWTPVVGIIYYRVYRATSSGDYSYPLTDFAIKGTSYVDVKIQPDTEYYYIVRPLISEGNAWEGLDEELGAASNEATSTTADEILEPETEKDAIAEKCYILLQINNPMMDVNGTLTEIDPGNGTAPMLRYDRTVLPIRAVTEAMSGTVGWVASEQKVTLDANDRSVEMWIGRMDFSVDGVSQTMDIAPFVENNRTMLPLRFVAANLNCQVTWINETKEILVVFYGVVNV